MFLKMNLFWSLSSPLPNLSYFFNQFNILLSIFRFYELLLDDCWVPQNVVQFLKRQNKSTIVISKSIYFSTAKLVQRLNNEINMLLYFREFLFFHTFSISFFSKVTLALDFQIELDVQPGRVITESPHSWPGNTILSCGIVFFGLLVRLLKQCPRTPWRPPTLNTNGSSVPCMICLFCNSLNYQTPLPFNLTYRSG